MFKQKVIGVSGICTNCDNEKICDFIREIKVFMRNKKSADKVLDTEVTIYSCDKYITAKEYPADGDGVCLYCKQDMAK